jgi:hypothetical protein
MVTMSVCVLLVMSGRVGQRDDVSWDVESGSSRRCSCSSSTKLFNTLMFVNGEARLLLVNVADAAHCDAGRCRCSAASCWTMPLTNMLLLLNTLPLDKTMLLSQHDAASRRCSCLNTMLLINKLRFKTLLLDAAAAAAAAQEAAAGGAQGDAAVAARELQQRVKQGETLRGQEVVDEVEKRLRLDRLDTIQAYTLVTASCSSVGGCVKVGNVDSVSITTYQTLTVFAKLFACLLINRLPPNTSYNDWHRMSNLNLTQGTGSGASSAKRRVSYFCKDDTQRSFNTSITQFII